MKVGNGGEKKMELSKDKAYANIGGVLYEYDLTLDKPLYVHPTSDGHLMYIGVKYKFIGCGTIDNVFGIKNHSKNVMYFYKKVVDEKGKKYGW